MKKKILFICLLIIIVLFVPCLFLFNNDSEIKTVKSDEELLSFGDNSNKSFSLFEKILLLPFGIFIRDYDPLVTEWNYVTDNDEVKSDNSSDESFKPKDYSKTNIQVEGVDEADIIKTDGDYIYSLSGSKVIVTNVTNPKNPLIEDTLTTSGIPNDLIIYKDKLVVISTSTKRYTDSSNRYSTRYYLIKDTEVTIYDVSDKTNIKTIKTFKLYEPYFTTRCIDGRLFVFSQGPLRFRDDKVVRDYKEDNEKKELKLSNIKYIKDNPKNVQTLIAEIDLNKISNIKLDSYLIDISESYISKNNIYLLGDDYSRSDISFKDLFGFGGVIGFFKKIDDSNYDSNDCTSIYKFNIDKKKGVTYKANTKVVGSIINQYSLDEKDDNLRIALENYNGTRVEILDKNLNFLGKTDEVAEGENMYSSRFIGDKAYLVTYKNTDPLFVIDLSNVKHPKVMGELHIPGYSTYLHPYDENHLIGIGMDTKEVVRRDFFGNVISESAIITGMKMSLFDVSDINNPKQLAKTTIGDSRTVSAILTNPKALLFSKEKNLLAIPVNHYLSDFNSESSDSYSSDISGFITKSKSYVSEGYFVYNIDLNGFKLKGVINHDRNLPNYYNNYSRLLRGVYIDDKLYTVSEENVKVNNLNDLKEISKLKIEKGDIQYEEEG